jgi:hypothetical protein
MLRDLSEIADDEVSELELQDLIDTAIYGNDTERTLVSAREVHQPAQHAWSPSSCMDNASACWSGILQRDFGQCQPGFVTRGGHFKNKICSNCRTHGLRVRASRIATIPSDLPSIANSSEAGFWNAYAGGAEYRVVSALAGLGALSHTRNPTSLLTPLWAIPRADMLTLVFVLPRRSADHTAKCVGPRLAIFHDDAPDLHGPPMLDVRANPLISPESHALCIICHPLALTIVRLPAAAGLGA